MKVGNEGPPPRLCVLTKERPGQEYGYNLHAEKGKGQFVGTVDAGSIAEKAGLKTGDRILAVNGASIIEENHKKVVERIKADPTRCSLLVIEQKGADWYTERGLLLPLQHLNDPIPQSMPSNNPSPPPNTWYAPQSKSTTQAEEMKPRPRLCELQKGSPNDEFGFNLHAEKGKGHFIGTVDAGGIGDRAGLRMGQRIVGVNGELVYPTTPHKDVVALIKRSPLHTQLLVASEEVDRWYAEAKEEYSFSYIEEGEKRSKTNSQSHSHHEPHQESHQETLTPHVDEEAVAVVERRMTQEVIASVYETPLDHHEDQEESQEETHEETHEDGDDLLAHVFASVPITTNITSTQVVTLAQPQDYLHENDHLYNPEPLTASPQSQHSSGYGHSDSSLNNHNHGYQPYGQQNGNAIGHGTVPNTNDIYGLSAKEARERLRNNKRNQRGAIDMSIEEKHRLIMNM